MKSLTNITGQIVEFCIGFPNKAIIEFTHAEISGRVILWSHKLHINGHALPPQVSVKKYLQLGSKVNFSCHSYSNPNNDNCGWFATSAYCADMDIREIEMLGIHSLGLITGIREQKGAITQISKRQAMISFSIDNAPEEKALLLASRFYFHNKKLSSNTVLSTVLSVYDEVKFDAVPFEDENDENCKWIATAAWMTFRPLLPYNDVPFQLPKYSYLESYKDALNNPNAKFLFGQGKVIKVLTNEYGICLSPVKENSWQTVLFHRSCAYLFGWNLHSFDLDKIFMPGDRVRFLAVPTALDSYTQWVAKQIFVDTTNVDFNF